MMIAAGPEQIWMWYMIYCKVDLIIILSSTYMPQTESVWGRGGRRKFVLFCSMNQTLQNVLEFISLFPWRKVMWWPCGETWRGVGLHHQWTYLVLSAFHRHSILSLIQISTSENEIEQTSWCNINSSNVLHILMIKNCFTFESNVTNIVIFELVMSSSALRCVRAVKHQHTIFHARVGLVLFP
jgi:hypothetical protein